MNKYLELVLPLSSGMTDFMRLSNLWKPDSLLSMEDNMLKSLLLLLTNS